MAGLLWYRSYMDSLANTSGYYPDIHAGHADRVTKLTLDVPYLVRETPAGYNSLELAQIIGGTVDGNQLCNSSSVTGTSGHKFYLKQSGAESITNTNTFTGLASGTDMVTDITLMLGSAIADYVYALEQATAGSGVEWLKSYDIIDGEYHAYSEPTLQSVEATAHVTKDANDSVIDTNPLDRDLVLRGIPKLQDGLLTYDGDTYEPDGTVTRRFAEVDLGNLTWYISGSGTAHYADLTNVLNPANNATPSAVCETYIGVPYNNWSSADDAFCLLSEKIWIRDADYNNVSGSAFKAAMSGVMLVYELIESAYTTESADPYTAVQTVEDGGTEEFVTTNGVPVGNVSVYRRA